MRENLHFGIIPKLLEPLLSQAQGTSLFTSAASNQRDCPEDSLSEVRVRLPEGYYQLHSSLRQDSVDDKNIDGDWRLMGKTMIEELSNFFKFNID